MSNKFILVGCGVFLVIALVIVFFLLASSYSQPTQTPVNLVSRSTTSADVIDSSLQETDKLIRDLESQSVPELDLEADFGL